MFEHVPLLLPVSAPEQALQRLLQMLLQQKPSTQKALKHCEGIVQGTLFNALHTPVSHRYGLLQGVVALGSVVS